MEHVDPARQIHRVDGAKGVATVVGDNFHHAGADIAQRLGIWVLAACLCPIERYADLVFDIGWEAS